MNKEQKVISIKIDPPENTNNLKYFSFKDLRNEYIYLYSRVELVNMQIFSINKKIEHLESEINKINENWTCFVSDSDIESKLEKLRKEFEVTFEQFAFTKLKDPTMIINNLLLETREQNNIIKDYSKLIVKNKRLLKFKEIELKEYQEYQNIILKELQKFKEFEEIQKLKDNTKYNNFKTFEEIPLSDLENFYNNILSLQNFNYIKLLNNEDDEKIELNNIKE